MNTMLEKLEHQYCEKIQEALDVSKSLSASLLIELSDNLFQKLKVENISDDDGNESDMLLYQYGVYNWGDETGQHFSFDITRQFIELAEDEPYQLSFTLIYNPEPFKELNSYSCWSSDFSDIESFFMHNSVSVNLLDIHIPSIRFCKESHIINHADGCTYSTGGMSPNTLDFGHPPPILMVRQSEGLK